MPGYESEAAGRTRDEKRSSRKNLRFLRDYQRALNALQDVPWLRQHALSVRDGNGYRQDTTPAAVIKLFLRTGNARWCCFCGPAELEDQAWKAFNAYLKNDYSTVIYKERRDDWRKAEIVGHHRAIAAVQSANTSACSFPTDFDLVISDEAHRSIGGNAGAVFEFCRLQARPHRHAEADYLGISTPASPTTRPTRARAPLLLDTYRTFRLRIGSAHFRYSLLDGVRDDVPVNPAVVDATAPMSPPSCCRIAGYAVAVPAVMQNGAQDQVFVHTHFEKFSPTPPTACSAKPSSRTACATRSAASWQELVVSPSARTTPPGSRKSSTNWLTRIWPGKISVGLCRTGHLPSRMRSSSPSTSPTTTCLAQPIFSITTRPARPASASPWHDDHRLRLPDILNLALMRPVFRRRNSSDQGSRHAQAQFFEARDAAMKPLIAAPDKTGFKLFDFLPTANISRKKFDHDEVLHLPARRRRRRPEPAASRRQRRYHHWGSDAAPADAEADRSGRHAHRPHVLQTVEETAKADDT